MPSRLLPFARFGIVAAAVIAACSGARAEDADSQFWGVFTYSARFSSGLRLYADVQPREGDNMRNFRQLVVRPIVGYQVSRHASVWLGYAWAPVFIPRYTNENRVFQQFQYEDNQSGFALTNRTRLEERSIQNAGETAFRLRHQFRLYHPLGRSPHWGVSAYDELFWNLNSTPHGPQSGFDQNRTYLGGAYNFSRHTRVELGYMAVFTNPPRNRPDVRYDVLQFTVNYTR